MRQEKTEIRSPKPVPLKRCLELSDFGLRSSFGFRNSEFGQRHHRAMNHSGFELGQFVGRFHVVLVHLPIGFLVLLAILELFALKPKFKRLTSARQVVLATTALAAGATAISGWLLAQA